MLITIPLISNAQQGSFDKTFGVEEKLITSLGNFGDKANSIAIQTDGTIILEVYFGNQ